MRDSAKSPAESGSIAKPTAGADAQPSTKRVLFWNTAGSIASACQSFVFLIFVTRVCGDSVAGDYSMGYAIAQLMWTIGIFEMTTFCVTDAANRYSSEQYLGFKLLSALLMVVASVIYVWSFHFEPGKAMLALWLCAFKLVDALGAYYYAIFQKAGRLDASGFALFWQNTIAMIAFVPLITLTKDPILSVAVATIAQGAWDAVYYLSRVGSISPVGTPDFTPRVMGSLFLQLLPLFLCTFLQNYVTNIPKYAIDEVGSATMQTVFNVLFMPSFAINLFVLFFLKPSQTTLADHWHVGDRPAFWGLTKRLLAGVAAVAAAILIGAWAVGIPLLEIVFAIDLDGTLGALVVILIGGSLLAGATILYNDLVIMRRQGLVLAAYVVTVLTGVITATPLVSSLGLMGAALASLIMQATLFVAYLVMLLIASGRLGARAS